MIIKFHCDNHFMIEVCESNHYAVHLKHTMLYVNPISIKLKGKKERKYTCIYFHPTFALLGMYYKEIDRIYTKIYDRDSHYKIIQKKKTI